MPKASDIPPGIRVLYSHGVTELVPSGDGSQHYGSCPFCAEEGKFYVNSLTGLWDCKRCHESGNATDFLRTLHRKSLEAVNDEDTDYVELASSRGLLSAQSLYDWGVCKSIISGEWLVPGYNANGDLCQLYRYVYLPNVGKWRMIASPSVKDMPSDEEEQRKDSIIQGLYGVNLYDEHRTDIYLVEGVWDGIALYELLGEEANILATPGALVFFESWTKYFKNKRVHICFDNDHPKPHPQNGVMQEPASYTGTKRVAGILKGLGKSAHPETLQYLKWGTGGYDPDLPSGYDLRDHLKGHTNRKNRNSALRDLLGRFHPVPDEWPSIKLGNEELTPIRCDNWGELLLAWKDGMEWTDGLEKLLTLMLASVLSTELIGEQIWLRVMAPPSSGKTTLCEGISVGRKYVYAVSTFTGFHSGYKTDKEGEEDYSLIPKVHNKSFIIKDGDTLLTAKNKDVILAEMRDIYDGMSRAAYRHGLSRAYENIRLTVMICGTGSLRSLDTSELGARCIDVVIDKTDVEQEKKICRRAIRRAVQNVKIMVNGKPESRGDEKQIKAKRMTGGYVCYLREHADKLINQVAEPDTETEERLMSYALFVAAMRARPSVKQVEVAEKELGARLSIQFARAAMCVAAILGKTEVDDIVMRRMRQIALDTARGQSRDIVDYMWKMRDKGADLSAMALSLGKNEDKLKDYMDYLKRIGVVQPFVYRESAYTQNQTRYKLTSEIAGYYDVVVNNRRV